MIFRLHGEHSLHVGSLSCSLLFFLLRFLLSDLQKRQLCRKKVHHDHRGIFTDHGEDTMEERMELLVRHRESVVEERRKWDMCLRNLDAKIQIYQKRMSER